jgi:energy-coupling factor transporter transmembrane protein EcfT
MHSGVQHILCCVFVVFVYVLFLVYSGVQYILCCVFVLFFFVLCTLCCQFLWTVHIVLPLLVFSNIYLQANRNAIAYNAMPPIREDGRVIWWVRFILSMCKSNLLIMLKLTIPTSPSGISARSLFWLSSLDPLVLLLPNVNNKSVWPSNFFDFGHTWWKLYFRNALCTLN